MGCSMVPLNRDSHKFSLIQWIQLRNSRRTSWLHMDVNVPNLKRGKCQWTIKFWWFCPMFRQSNMLQPLDCWDGNFEMFIAGIAAIYQKLPSFHSKFWSLIKPRVLGCIGPDFFGHPKTTITKFIACLMTLQTQSMRFMAEKWCLIIAKPPKKKKKNWWLEIILKSCE